MPRGESEDREMGIDRAGMFMMFPRRQFFIFQHPLAKANGV
jgi:hypothetical protein